MPVEATRVQKGDIAAFYTGTASLEAEDEALVVAKAGGIVERIFVEEGDYVRAGQALAKLDDDRLTLELDRVQMTLDQQKRIYDRNEELHKKKLISQEEYERLKSEYETQQAARDLAALEVEYTTIRAPISGVISERMIKTGNMVGTHATAFRLTDFDPLLAVIHVPERELNRLKKGQSADLKLDALPGQAFTGRIERISPVVDPTTGTFEVTVEIRDKSGRIKPGMFGRVHIVYDTHEDVLLLPKEAVQSEDDESAVYVVEDSIAVRRLVEPGYVDDRYVEIISGVSLDDLVITTGQGGLRDSARVEVISGQ